jgi:hypothetical protein
MSGAGDNRPYRDYGTFDIQQRIGRLEGFIRESQREYKKLKAMGATEDAQVKLDTIHMNEREIKAYTAELTIREREEQGRGNGPRPESISVTVICSCPRPRYFRLPGKVYDMGPIICGNCNQPFRLK